MAPTDTAVSLRDRFAEASTLSSYLEQTSENRDLWESIWRRSRVAPDHVARVEALPGMWHLLVLCAHWCGDGANTAPVVARLAASAQNLELRVLDRDENPDLRDAHLTIGARSIPVVMVLDADFEERDWWGPRPAPIQRWVRDEGMQLPAEERYRHVRAWYARDRGQTTVEEIVRMLEHAAATGNGSAKNGQSGRGALSTG